MAGLARGSFLPRSLTKSGLKVIELSRTVVGKLSDRPMDQASSLWEQVWVAVSRLELALSCHHQSLADQSRHHLAAYTMRASALELRQAWELVAETPGQV